MLDDVFLATSHILSYIWNVSELHLGNSFCNFLAWQVIHLKPVANTRILFNITL